MQGNHHNRSTSINWPFLFMAFAVIGLCTAVDANAQLVKNVDISISSDGNHDTLWAGIPSTFDVYLENNFVLAGMCLGFEIWSSNGATWDWLAQPGGYGTTTQCVTIVPYSRLDPNGDGSALDVFEISDLFVTEENITESGKDTIMVSGLSFMAGLYTGPLQHMYSYHFTPNIPDASPIYSLCFDSCFVPPSPFVFVSTSGGEYPPAILWNNGGECWPVRKPYTCIDSDGDGFGDPGHPENDCPLDNCPDIYNPDQLDHDGDDVGNECDVCPGFDDNEDADLDEVPDGCDNCPYAYNQDQEDYDGDMLGDSCDPCNNIPPTLVNAGDTMVVRFDTAMAFYPVVTDPDDAGHTLTYLEYPHWCMIQNDSLVGDIPDTVFAEPLTVIVQDACNVDTLATIVIIYICGNANGDLSVNVGDAVYIINFVFKGGNPPVPYESGDANGDGDANVADAVYLINYVFKGGPAPECPE